jgi:hypothetical protein
MKKRILGITALLAVLAMCLTFTACPPPEDNVVTFFNETALNLQITIKGGETFSLNGIVGLADPSTHTVTKSGDIVLQTITASGYSQEQLSQYIEIDGALTGGKQKYKDGINLGSGAVYFKADRTVTGNPAIPLSINIIP